MQRIGLSTARSLQGGRREVARIYGATREEDEITGSPDRRQRLTEAYRSELVNYLQGTAVSDEQITDLAEHFASIEHRRVLQQEESDRSCRRLFAALLAIAVFAGSFWWFYGRKTRVEIDVYEPDPVLVAPTTFGWDYLPLEWRPASEAPEGEGWYYRERDGEWRRLREAGWADNPDL